jgi:hypothetical protein
MPIKLKTPISGGVANAMQVPRKCKGCTFNVVSGNQTTADKKAQVLGEGASNTVAGKKSGPIIKADSGAKVNTLTGPGNIQATNGNNNAPQLSAPVQQAADWRAVLAKPAGVIGAGIIGLLVSGGIVCLMVWWRRKKAGETLV